MITRPTFDATMTSLMQQYQKTQASADQWREDNPALAAEMRKLASALWQRLEPLIDAAQEARHASRA